MASTWFADRRRVCGGIPTKRRAAIKRQTQAESPSKPRKNRRANGGGRFIAGLARMYAEGSENFHNKPINSTTEPTMKNSTCSCQSKGVLP